jgi:hypothetical protein
MRRVTDQERISIGCSFRHEVAAERTRRAGAVVDNELLAECFTQLLADNARNRVG